MSHLGPTLRRRRRPVSAARRIALAAALSLLANLLLLLRLDLSWLDSATAPRRAVAVAPLTARDWEKNRAVAGQQPRPQPVQRLPAPPPAPPPDRPEGQVVRVAPPREPPKEPPRDAKYLSEQDSKVEKETRSRFAANGLGKPAPVPTSPARPEPLRGPRGQPDADAQARQEEQKKEQAPPPEPRRLAFDWRPGATVRQEARRRPEPAQTPALPTAPARPGEKGLPGADGSTLPPGLRPSAAAYQSLAGGPANDHLPDVEEGEATFLNTREWRYAGYFNLITERVDEQWVTAGRREVEQRDPSGQRFLYKDRLVVLDVTLDDRGSVRNVRVSRSTGVEFLDRVAVDMFRKAEAFANPPRGIIDANGQINFAFGINFVGVSPSMGLLRRPSFRE
ncbi:MAG: TonB family protein [Deltaproteobacteria bacterium]|nr:TonB family protein [Deltaproteobacteria bacterium]